MGGFQPRYSATDVLLVICRLQELDRKPRVSPSMRFLHLHKPYDSVDRERLWNVLAVASVSEEITAMMNQFHGDGHRNTIVCMGYGSISDWFEVR